jgi:hypothetical protein
MPTLIPTPPLPILMWIWFFVIVAIQLGGIGYGVYLYFTDPYASIPTVERKCICDKVDLRPTP